MNQGKYIFAQLTDFLPRRVFDRLLEKYSGNKKIRTFTCWNQIQCMIFGQLTARDSMRDLMLSLEAHKNKYYHLGLGSTVIWGIERSGFFNGREKWAKGFENQMV